MTDVRTPVLTSTLRIVILADVGLPFLSRYSGPPPRHAASTLMVRSFASIDSIISTT